MCKPVPIRSYRQFGNQVEIGDQVAMEGHDVVHLQAEAVDEAFQARLGELDDFNQVLQQAWEGPSLDQRRPAGYSVVCLQVEMRVTELQRRDHQALYVPSEVAADGDIGLRA